MGTRGIEQSGRINWLNRDNGVVYKSGMGGGMLAAQLQQSLDGQKLVFLVVTQTARVVVNNISQVGAAVGDLEHFIDLLLIFDTGDADFSIMQHMKHFLRHCAQIERTGYGSDGHTSHNET